MELALSIFATFAGFEPLALRFALASGGCVAAGLGVWAVTALCRRWLPGVAAQRSVWLLGQCTVVLAFLLILLPQSERLRMLPPIDIESFSTPAAAPRTGNDAATPATVTPAPAATTTPQTYLAWAAQSWLLLYALGLAYTLLQLLHTRRALHALAVAGNKSGVAPVDTIEVDAPISPMLFGLFRPRLLLPLHLRAFDADQRQMILEHELTHWRRNDLQWASAGIVLQTLLWFNPFMRLLRIQLSWAQELGCDREVLQGRPPAQRKAYAAALVAQLKLQQAPISTALAFGNVTPATLADRIALIRNPGKAPQGPWVRIATLAGLAAVLATSLALQPSLASQSPTLLSCTTLMDAATGQRLRHDGQCDARATPASTFNIVVSLMGYDSGHLIDEHTPLLPYKPTYASWNSEWRADTDPTSWIKYSNVWYAQQVTTKLGDARFQHYIDSFGYGNRDVSGDAGKHNGLTQSWIGSSLAISPDEQVDFLRKIVNRQLPVSVHAYEMTARILNPQTLDNGWTISGKTGTASPVLADGRDDNTRQYGWYVGWATKGARTIVFARMVLDHRQETYAGLRTRQAFLRDVATQLDTL
ncbi:class D beta-lactamase [Pseudoduganella sp. FT25W]|uniref:Class D beta-lactamase n=1 Tax=Duganella alba TaxID=2666081 RepID=A0A6L5QHM9_9BURK|nr:class D beta-lactamase [Duganella alba]MRX17259.1 class D beta-lactamase [Duganella alba]